MKKLLLPVLVSLILTSSFSNAEITSFDERFTVLCEIEGSTGFNWSNGNWHQTNFKAGQKYIINKQDMEKYFRDEDFDRSKVKYDMCAWEREEEDNWTFTIRRDACYSIREFGEEESPFDGTICREYWDVDEQGSMKLNTVRCLSRGFDFSTEFKPNGLIHIYNIGNLESHPKAPVSSDGKQKFGEDDTKASMYVSFGRCSTI